MQKLTKCINKGHLTDDPDLIPFRDVFWELTNFDGVVLQGEKLLIPDSEFTPGISLRQMIVDLAHEGHQGEVKSKRYLRSRVWFPHMDKLVSAKVADCLG